MKRLIRQLMLPTAVVVLALLAPAAASASVLEVQRDCADSDVFERKHSRADLNATLNNIQADLAEYGECKRMIQAALAALGPKAGASGNSGDGGPINPDLNGDGVVTPKERKIAAKRAKQKRERSRQLAAVSDDLIQDDAAAASGGGGGGGDSSLPMILGLVALLCAAGGGGLWYASKRNPDVANALRRVPLPFRNS